MPELNLEFTLTINWSWLYKPADSISTTAPGLPSGKTPLPGSEATYVPGSGALMSCERSRCRPCELANVIATVVLRGTCRSNATADCTRYGARRVELISWMVLERTGPGRLRTGGTAGKKSGFAMTYCCSTAPL